MASDLMLHRTLADAERAIRELDDTIRTFWRTARDERVRNACSAVMLVATFRQRCFDAKSVLTADVQAAVRTHTGYTDAFARIHDNADKFSHCLAAIETRQRKSLVEKLTTLADHIRTDLGVAVGVFIEVVNDCEARRVIGSSERDRALNLANEVKVQLGASRFLSEDERELDEQRKNAGDTAVKLLGGFYEDYAAKENRRADALRNWAIVFLLLITGIAAVVNFRTHDLTVGLELLRLTATIPLAVLAAYLGRESSRHRRFARWADELAIQTRSLSAYADSLGDHGIELRRAFGQKIFGAAGDSADSSEEPGMLDVLKPALDLATPLTDRRENRP